MHFLSAGRDDRIHRWITDQVPKDDELEQGTPRQWQDSLEKVDRKQHDELVDMEWELEELERQMALTAFAFGREHWGASRLSVDSARRSLLELKRSSQLTVRPHDFDVEQTAPRDELDRRREGRIISQPPAFPPDLPEPDVPRPIMARTRAAPPPITTAISRPPITFVLQESASPLPSTMHFTPTPMDLDAFPSTPRSFTSFAAPAPSEVHHSEAHPSGMFLSPRLQMDQAQLSPQRSGHDDPSVILEASPMTPYSCTSPSDVSTPSLSAFPATPGTPISPYPGHPHGFPFPCSGGGFESEDIPPVPPLPVHAHAHPKHLPDRNKDLPPSPTSSKPSPQLYSSSSSSSPSASRPSIDLDDADGTRSESEISVDGQLSSRFSVFSSRFSVSSEGSAKRAASRSASRSGIRSRARAASAASRPRVEPAPPPTASVRNLMMSVSRMSMGTLKRSRSHGALPKPVMHAHNPSPSLSAATLLGGRSRSPSLSRAGAPKTPADRSRFGVGGEPKTPQTASLVEKLAQPATPVEGPPPTPSSAVSAFFDMARGASVRRKHRLVVRGVPRDEQSEEGVRRWCEGVGPVKHIGRAPGSEDIHVHFRDKEAYKKTGSVDTRKVHIPHVGSVTLTWTRSSTRGMR